MFDYRTMIHLILMILSSSDWMGYTLLFVLLLPLANEINVKTFVLFMLVIVAVRMMMMVVV